MDEREDLVNSLEHAVEIARTVRSEPRNWKWLLIVVHNTLQGALVSVLIGTNGLGALKKKCMAEWLQWHEKRRAGKKEPPPKEFLASPLELYCRAKQKDFMCESIGRPLDGRTNIVLSRRAGYEAAGCRTAASMDAALAAARETGGGQGELMVIGGAEVYGLALPIASRLYLTRVRGRFEGDVYFPPYDESEWIEEAREAGDDADGPACCFVTYRRPREAPAR